MLKWSRTFLAWSLVGAALALVVYGTTFLPSYRKCIGNDAQHESPDKTADLDETLPGGSRIYVLPPFLLCEGRFADENGAVITALATIAIAAFTATLWITTGRQVRLAREEFLATHRPEIVIHSVEIAHDTAADPQHPALGA